MEPLNEVNQRLIDYFGKDIITNLPIWRIVWSHDQFEKVLRDITETEIKLLEPIVMEVPKYRSYIHNKWILERLVVVPEFQQKELGIMISYEPIFVFETGNGQFLPYKWEAAKFVIDTIMAAQGKSSLHAKYVDPEKDQPLEKQEERITKLQEELFGNETNTGDALAHRQGVAGFHSKLVH